MMLEAFPDFSSVLNQVGGEKKQHFDPWSTKTFASVASGWSFFFFQQVLQQQPEVQFLSDRLRQQQELISTETTLTVVISTRQGEREDSLAFREY